MTLKQIRNYLQPKLIMFSVMAVLLVPLLIANIAAAAGKECQGVTTAYIECDPNVGTGDGDSPILALLLVVLQIMTAGVGIVAVGGLIYGGILYASAADSPDKVRKAIEVIRNVIIGVVAYLAMYSLLNFLIPGGIFT